MCLVVEVEDLKKRLERYFVLVCKTYCLGITVVVNSRSMSRISVAMLRIFVYGKAMACKKLYGNIGYAEPIFAESIRGVLP